jgi:hypothetical protein
MNKTIAAAAIILHTTTCYAAEQWYTVVAKDHTCTLAGPGITSPQVLEQILRNIPSSSGKYLSTEYLRNANGVITMVVVHSIMDGNEGSNIFFVNKNDCDRVMAAVRGTLKK